MIQLWKPENLKKEETKMLNSDSIISPGSITLYRFTNPAYVQAEGFLQAAIAFLLLFSLSKPSPQGSLSLQEFPALLSCVQAWGFAWGFLQAAIAFLLVFL